MFCIVLKSLAIIASPSLTETRVMRCYTTCSVAYVLPSPMFLLVTQLLAAIQHTCKSLIYQAQYFLLLLPMEMYRLTFSACAVHPSV